MINRLRLRNFIAILFVNLLLLVDISIAEVEIRNITPPKLDQKNLGQKIIGYRPMRRISPRMEVENMHGKVIVHNYGHGGSGWTLAPGAATYVNDLLVESKHANSLKLDTPINIIGAGALGLFSAYDLLQKGYNNITIFAEDFDNLTSHKAGGLLAPVSMDNDPKMQKVIDKISIDSYKFYHAITNKKHPHFAKGAINVPAYFQSKEDSGLEPYVGKVMSPAKDVWLDFNNGTKRQMVVYDDGIFIDTGHMMDALRSYLQNSGVRFVREKITSYKQLKAQYVFNCAGMGAKYLNDDDKMVSVQGHLIMLKDQIPSNLQYVLLVYLDEGVTDSGDKIKRSFYIFPKHSPNADPDDIGVIGGTFVEHAGKTNLNTQEFPIIVQNAKEFYGIKDN